MTGVYFLHRIRHYDNNGTPTWDKGIEVKDQKDEKGNYGDAKQAYHAYWGAYAYGHNASTDYVDCFISDSEGRVVLSEEPWSADPVNAE